MFPVTFVLLITSEAKIQLQYLFYRTPCLFFFASKKNRGLYRCNCVRRGGYNLFPAWSLEVHFCIVVKGSSALISAL